MAYDGGGGSWNATKSEEYFRLAPSKIGTMG